MTIFDFHISLYFYTLYLRSICSFCRHCWRIVFRGTELERESAQNYLIIAFKITYYMYLFCAVPFLLRYVLGDMWEKGWNGVRRNLSVGSRRD